VKEAEEAERGRERHREAERGRERQREAERERQRNVEGQRSHTHTRADQVLLVQHDVLGLEVAVEDVV
jgi:hypothetical protein